MKTFANNILWLLACLFFPLNLGAEETPDTSAMMQDDYIRASLLIVDPASEVYSLFGHCALRLDCPSQQMDYCFTFETSTDTKGLLSFMRGTAMGGFMASQTDHYLSAYRQAGRGVTQYDLNLTPTEKLLLWQIVDDELARGFCRHYDYLHTQCTSMVVSLVKRALKNQIVYSNLPEQLNGSFRDVLFTTARHPWSVFFWQTVMGPDADATQPLEDKLVPVLLPQVWQKATVGQDMRRLITADSRCLVDVESAAASPLSSPLSPLSTFLSPLSTFILLLLLVMIVTAGQLMRGWRLLPLVTDVVLLTLHTVLSFSLLWLVLFSQLEGTQWNWYLLVFNPLPLLLWLALRSWRTWIVRCYLAVLILVMALIPLIPQLDMPHGLLMACVAVRLLPRIGINYNMNVSLK